LATNANRLLGTVVRIHDGDSFLARLDDGSQRVIRMSGIDAPERDQPGGDAARHRLAALLADLPLRIEPVKLDRFGRTVARVVIETGHFPPSAIEADGATDVGLLLLAEGHAWHFSRYASEQPASEREAYARAQATARAQRLGLWADDGPIPPWEHRVRRRRDARR
jgi:endonuclease YncB( thermonuclease family)